LKEKRLVRDNGMGQHVLERLDLCQRTPRQCNHSNKIRMHMSRVAFRNASIYACVQLKKAYEMRAQRAKNRLLLACGGAGECAVADNRTR